MKNFKPQTHAPKGALCACKDRLGPHFLSMAEGGSVSDDEYNEQLQRALRSGAFKPRSGRRHEVLNASRDVNAPAQLARGWAAGTLGLPGDIEGLLRLVRKGMGSLPESMESFPGLPGLVGKSLRKLGNKDIDTASALPTSDFYQEWLPGRDESPAGRAFSEVGSLAGGAGATNVARGVQKGSGAVAKGALESIARAMEGQGPLRALVAPSAPAYAMRPRGGNFRNPDMSDLGGWIPENLDNRVSPQQAWADKVLRNYVKRDLGAPTDPLLSLEKELPGLHLPEGQLEDEIGSVNQLYDARESLRRRPGDPNIWSGVEPYLNEHEALSGGERLTPWGRVSDAEVLGIPAGRDLADELSGKWPIQTMYPDRTFADTPGAEALQGLLDHTDNILSRYVPDIAAAGGDVSPRKAKLDAYRKMLDDAMANDWRAKKPDDPVYSLVGGAGERLGFDHIMDYIEAATGPYTRFGKDTPEAEELRALIGRNDVAEAPYTMPAGEFREMQALHQAGLTLDPASLDRVSMPDMVRRVAKWNEYMAAKKEQDAAGPLSKGWKVHKEYPDQGGMKWVEFGKPDETGIADELAALTPDKFSLQELGDVKVVPRGNPGEFWAVDQYNGEILGRGPTYQAARDSALAPMIEQKKTLLRREKLEGPLQEGLRAEGDAMGHCVGGYCDDVLERGTKIYSLRDAKGQPHVTVEVAQPTEVGYRDWEVPISERERAAIEKHIKPEDVERFRANFGTGRIGTPRLQRAWVVDNFPTATELGIIGQGPLFTPPPSIVQIKGKGNAAPVDKYLPMVQDFVKSQQWGRVGDLQNTGLIEFKGGKTNIRDPNLGPRTDPNRRVFENIEMPSGYMTAEDAMQHLMAQGVPEDMARQHVGNFAPRRRNYAQGGSVQADPNGPGPGFIPRTFEEVVDYIERVYAQHGA